MKGVMGRGSTTKTPGSKPAGANIKCTSLPNGGSPTTKKGSKGKVFS